MLGTRIMAVSKLSRASTSQFRRLLPCRTASSEALLNSASSSAFRVSNGDKRREFFLSVDRSFLSTSSAWQAPPEHSPEKLPPLPPPHRLNPPDETNPDPVTLQEQWRYATRMYSKWYAHAWGTAILAGLSFFGIGWVVKGGNPLTFGASEKKEEAK